jgi:hypothetical protein
MTQRRKISTAIAGVLAVIMVSAGAQAGSSSYDPAPVLNNSYPHAQAPNTPPPAEDTLVAILGLTTPSKSLPAQVANSSQVAAAVPQQASVGLTPPQNGDPSFITISGGWYDFNDNEQAAELTAEWRSNKMLWIFKPFAGAMVTTDAGVYGFGGILTDFYFGRRIVVTPSVAIGLYADGDGKDLGSIFEIRSGLEVGWRFDNRARISAAIYHISNASIGSSNPGTEIFSIGYSFPLR